MQFHFNQLSFPPDTPVSLSGVLWQDFEQLMDELGEKSGLRVYYDQGEMQFMAPSAGYEDHKNIIGDLVKCLLDVKDIEFRALGSTTFRKRQVHKAVEADECFYIEHEAAIRGKTKVNLDTDPPPDLAIEIDVSSKTDLGLYEALEVPELWRYDGQQLEIFVLQGGVYQVAAFSPHFPGLDLKAKIPACLEQSRRDGRNAAMKGFRQWLAGQGQGCA